MLIRVDASSGGPLFEQIASSIRKSVSQGVIRPGERLPTAKALAATMGINIHTVLHAYQVLQNEGSIELRRGRGATVLAKSEATLVDGLVDQVVAEARVAGISVDELKKLIERRYERG